MVKAARRLRSFTAPNLTPVPAWTRHESRRPKPGTARASGRERGPGPEEAVRAAAAAPPVGLSAPPTSSKAEPAPEQREAEAVEEEERSEPSPGALRDRVPGGGGGGTAHRQIRAQRAAGAAATKRFSTAQPCFGSSS
ncbi:guanine nucleotide-binding protein G(I)/G(S)/G(O) subunit gamma-12 isoform 2-T2 [Hipposideros larvatus]